MLAPRTVREITQLPKETQKNGDTNKSKGTNEHAKHKPRLNMQNCWLGDRKGIRPVKCWVLVCWWWWFDWSFACLI